ncbi:polymeric immunoglobulin receptor-like [Sebastes umbrosus]|uniref:polymeric immunoglobulin receptor-like n=1 Tax=Sebastes umbrosus TaxID=72105 RepID=UPI0018A0F8E2|nr:polymeric immunoglobulin receptor-like [Sebastes umbrosus]
MTVHLSFLLIITGLTGIHTIITVSKVSVKAGDSISIPCLYGSQYMNHVKYLCKGYYWDYCSIAVKTNQPRSSGKFSISDDKEQRIFTVTIKDLTDEDIDYWCNVEITNGPDVGEYFHLSVNRDTPSLYVDHQEITGFKGGNITINCHGNSGEIAWCRPGVYCVTTSSGSIDGTRVTINANVPNVFTVTMSGLRTESSGWYWCLKGDLQMPVHVTVTEQPTTNKPSTTVQGEQHSRSVPVDLMHFIIPLSLLFFVVMVTLCIWFMFKRHKRTKAESSATTTAQEEVTYSIVKKKRRTSAPAEEEVTYSNVTHMRKTSVKRSEAKSDVDVMYSSVDTVKQQTVQPVEAKDEDVTYSRLAQNQQNL